MKKSLPCLFFGSENAERLGAAAETTSDEQLSYETAGKSVPGRTRATPNRGL